MKFFVVILTLLIGCDKKPKQYRVAVEYVDFSEHMYPSVKSFYDIEWEKDSLKRVQVFSKPDKTAVKCFLSVSEKEGSFSVDCKSTDSSLVTIDCSLNEGENKGVQYYHSQPNSAGITAYANMKLWCE